MVTDPTTAALEAARTLARAGIPIFVAYPDANSETGYRLPNGWQKTKATPSYVDAWKPGRALVAVMGQGLDLVDIDPRNGGDPASLDGLLPKVYARADTPSVGLHYFVKSLGVRSRDDFLPGVDFKAGDVDGGGRGFAFLAPTVRKSKVDGLPYPYRWIELPDLAGIEDDDSGAALRDLIQSTRASSNGSAERVDVEAILAGVPEGGRDTALFKYAARLQALGVNRAEAEILVLDAAARCQPPFPEREALAKVASAYDRYPPVITATLTDSRRTPPAAPVPYPVEALPPLFLSFVCEAREALGVDPAMVALPLLTNAGAALGNRKAIELKPGYWQRAILWDGVVAAPGTAKTPAQSAANAPLVELQREARDAHVAALAAYDAEMAQWEAAPKAERGVRPERPIMQHFLTTDATIEALGAIVDTSPGVVLQRDELVGWVTSFDAYRKGGERQSHLSMWAGAPLKVDRRSRDPLFVEHPVVCVSGGVQPDMLRDLAAESGRRDGFLERFLWSMPDTTPARWSTAEISAATRGSVLRVFRDLRHAPTSDEPVRMSTSAAARWSEWYDENAALTARSGGMMAGVSAKLPNQVARLALVLHCVADPREMDRPLTVATLDAAIALAEYHRTHAHRVLSLIAEVGELAQPLTIRVRRILATANDGLSRTELHARLGGSARAEDLTAALGALEGAGLASMDTPQPGEGPGRRAEVWRATEPPVPGAMYPERNEVNEEIPQPSPISSYDSFLSGSVSPETRPCVACKEPIPQGDLVFNPGRVRCIACYMDPHRRVSA